MLVDGMNLDGIDYFRSLVCTCHVRKTWFINYAEWVVIDYVSSNIIILTLQLIPFIKSIVSAIGFFELIENMIEKF